MPQGVDDFLPYRVQPSQFGTAAEFLTLVSRYPIPAAPLMAGLNVRRMCVWDTIAVTLGMDPIVAWANYMAFLPQANRTPALMAGEVPPQLLPAIFAHFRVGGSIYRANRNGIRYEADPGTPALHTFPGDPGWPTGTFLWTTENGGSHILAAPPEFVPGALMPPIDPRLNVAGNVTALSRTVSPQEMASVMNIPLRFAQSYHAFTGFQVNAAAATSTLHGFQYAGPAPYAPFQPLPRVPVVAERFVRTLNATEVNAARALAKDLKEHSKVINSSEVANASVAKSLDAILDFPIVRPIEWVLLNGATGSGKSFESRNQVRQLVARGEADAHSLRIHTWYNALRAQTIRDYTPLIPGARGGNFPSATCPLYECTNGTLVLDDAGLLWPGFLELVILTNPGLRRVVINFDAAQARPPFPEADSLTRDLPSTVEWLSGLSANYATEMKRLSTENTITFGFPEPRPAPGYTVTHGAIYIVSKAPAGIPIFAASPRFVETLNRGNAKATAFSDAQGVNINGDICIDAEGLTPSATDSAIWPVLCRGNGNIFIKIGEDPVNSPLLVSPTYGASRILSAILAVASHHNTAYIDHRTDTDQIIARAVHSHLARSLSPAACRQLGLAAPLPNVAGLKHRTAEWTLSPSEELMALDLHPLLTREAIYRTTNPVPDTRPAFSAIRPDRTGPDPRLDFVQHAVRHYYPVANDGVVRHDPSVDVAPDPVAPDVPFDPVLLHEDLAPVELREHRVNGILPATAQFDEHAAEGIPKHRRTDPATFNWALNRRIKIGPHSGKLNGTDRLRVNQLREGFAKFFDVKKKAFSQMRFEEAGAMALKSWAGGKTAAEIQRSLEVEPDDHPEKFLALFLKGQSVKKLATYGKAKPGQIISPMAKRRTFEDLLWMYYFRGVARTWQRHTTYVNDQPMTVHRAWYQKHFKSGKVTANDYTSWDSGCDHVFVHFNCWMLRMAGVPDSYIAGYFDRRLNMYSHLGHHAPQQNSGDAWTLVFNSYDDAALTGASLTCPVGTPAAFLGDDSAVENWWRTPVGFNPNQWPMQPKRQLSTEDDFCGTVYGRHQLYVSSASLLHRAKAAIRDGTTSASYWNSWDYAARWADPHEPTPTLATALRISADARIAWNLPPSKFPHASR